MTTLVIILAILGIVWGIYNQVRRDATDAHRGAVANNTLEKLKEINDADTKGDKKLERDVNAMRDNPMAWWLRRGRNGDGE
jgi:hypothetical protein|tara:strand:+ start:381 stop:623 length:243 start_codon:yes stop_codon:yes gene_type:complete